MADAAFMRTGGEVRADNAATPHATFADKRVFVARGLSLRGALEGCEQLAVAGHVEADVALRAIEILDQGRFEGTAKVDEARITGRFDGVLIVEDTLVLGACGYIHGSVRCGRLELEEGGRIEGELHVRAAEMASAAAAGGDVEFEALLLAAAPSSEADADREEEAKPADEASHESDAIGAAEALAVAACEETSLAAAEVAFRSALTANPGDIAALSGLGHVARERGELTAALDYFNLAIAADAQNPSLYRVRDNILCTLSRRAGTNAAADAAMTTHPAQLSPALPGLADDCGDSHDLPNFTLDQAEAMFLSVLERHPRNLGALAGLGHIARRRGDCEAMRRYYGAALDADPMNLTLRVEVARAFKQVGDFANARAILETDEFARAVAS